MNKTLWINQWTENSIDEQLSSLLQSLNSEGGKVSLMSNKEDTKTKRFSKDCKINAKDYLSRNYKEYLYSRAKTRAIDKVCGTRAWLCLRLSLE